MLRDRGDIPVGSEMSFFHKGKACPGGHAFLVSAGLFLALSALPVILADGLFLKHDGNIVAHRKNQTADVYKRQGSRSALQADDAQPRPRRVHLRGRGNRVAYVYPQAG